MLDYAGVALGTDTTRTVTVEGPVATVAATTLRVDPVAVPHGLLALLLGNVRPTAHLATSSDGAPLAGQQILFYAQGIKVCAATTDRTGTARCRTAVPILVALLVGGFEATYAGNASYLPAQGRGGVTG